MTGHTVDISKDMYKHGQFMEGSGPRQPHLSGIFEMGIKASKLSRIFRDHRVKRLNGSPLTPKGYVPVCVGVNDEIKRFIVHRTSLTNIEFLELLCRSAEEYGFQNQGVLRIPYDAKDFEEWMIRKAGRKMSRVRPTQPLKYR